MLTIVRKDNLDTTTYTTTDEKLIIDPVSGSMAFADSTGVTTLGGAQGTPAVGIYTFYGESETTVGELMEVISKYTTIRIENKLTIHISDSDIPENSSGDYVNIYSSFTGTNVTGGTIVFDIDSTRVQRVIWWSTFSNVRFEIPQQIIFTGVQARNSDFGNAALGAWDDLVNCSGISTVSIYTSSRVFGCDINKAVITWSYYCCGALTCNKIETLEISEKTESSSGSDLWIMNNTIQKIRLLPDDTVYTSVPQTIPNGIYMLNNVIAGHLTTVSYESM